MNTLEQFTKARKVSCPLMAISTTDPASTIRSLEEGIEEPVLQWDISRGLIGRNESGQEEQKRLFPDPDMDDTKGNPSGVADRAQELPTKSVLFVHFSHRFMDDVMFLQSIWNLRDTFKRNMRMVILLGSAIKLPPEISGDIISINEPLPAEERLAEIVQNMHEIAKLEIDDDTVAKCVDALAGLPEFQAEQLTALSLRKEGIDINFLWESKRKQIESTPGLSVSREGIAFDDLGGLGQIKSRLRGIFNGKKSPRCVVWLDEIEKMIAGAGTDTSGVSTDQLGSLLTYMQDHHARGMIFVGAPGSGKSAIAKAAGNEAGIPTIRLDLGAMRDQFVGSSEQRVREALQVITAVGSDKTFWIATCNSLDALPPELRRRFSRGIYFFDLPNDDERVEIWKVFCERYDVKYEPIDDLDWTGAEIEQCCEIANDENMTISEAAKHIVPVSQSSAGIIDRLRKQAHNRFLSASNEGVYTNQEFGNGGRSIEV